MILYALPNGLSRSRIGLAVGRKIGGAVIRNRVKRRLREVLRDCLGDFPLRCDMVVVAKSQAVDAEFSDLRSGIFKALRGLTNETGPESTTRGV